MWVAIGALGLVNFALATLAGGLLYDVRAGRRKIKKFADMITERDELVEQLRRTVDARWKWPYEHQLGEEEFLGTEVAIGEKAIVDAYVRVLDNLWRVRTGLYQASPLYIVEKAQAISGYADELANLVEYWREDEQQPPRWDVVVKAIKCRAMWPGAHQRAVAVVDPLPWEYQKQFEQPSIVCPICNMPTYNPHDIRTGWCANCDTYTAIGIDGEDRRR